MRYICSVCGYVFDEQQEGKRFADLPEDWVCPLCGAPKAMFEKEEAEPAAYSAPAVPAQVDSDLKELKAGELSCLFSNLARGCEKQYKDEEAKRFLEIAAYFEKITPAEETHQAEDLAELIAQNLREEYPALERAAKEAGDRGTLRAYTWGLKVTRMQQALMERYLKEGEAFLEHTNVWVCTVCGFIYIGDNPPALCPVCKVPDWKFEKVKGGATA